MGTSSKRLPSFHEDFSPRAEPGPTNRSFGLTMTAACTIIAVLKFLAMLRPGGPPRALFWPSAWGLISLAFLACTFCKPIWLSSINRLWTKLGLAMYKISNPVCMAVLFYGVIAPMALLARRLGKVSMTVGFDHDKLSYWTARERGKSFQESLRQQF